jgi:hypothetical protein
MAAETGASRFAAHATDAAADNARKCRSQCATCWASAMSFRYRKVVRRCAALYASPHQPGRTDDRSTKPSVGREGIFRAAMRSWVAARGQSRPRCRAGPAFQIFAASSQRDFRPGQPTRRCTRRFKVGFALFGQPHGPRRALEKPRADPGSKALYCLADIPLAGARKLPHAARRRRNGDVVDGERRSWHRLRFPRSSTLGVEECGIISHGAVAESA